MQVFKFGGASIQSADRFNNTATIIDSFADEKRLVVVSAMGKTTNALEAVVQAYYRGDKEQAMLLFSTIRSSHQTLSKQLHPKTWKEAEAQLLDFFTEVEWLLQDKPVRPFDYYYDQIVSIGELLSSTILYYLLRETNNRVAWLDIRDVIKTDNQFRNAGILTAIAEKQAQEHISRLFDTNEIVIVQGFIGSTEENESTTLGREGSDYTAAVLASFLEAASVTIWKDVEAVMSADPKKFPAAEAMHSLSFREVIEMAYYGAQVIHPKTIKPLQNKNIPLHVRCFLNPDAKGTVISARGDKKLPPVLVQKENLVLLQFSTQDFSFIGDEPLSQLQSYFRDARIQPIITQNTAISLLCVTENHPEKIEQLCLVASTQFDVTIEKNLELLTIRHYRQSILNELTEGKDIVMEQRTPETVQLIMRKAAS